MVKINPIEGFEILGLGVRPESKQQGVGTKLLQQVLMVAVENSFKAVEAEVFADNIAMLRLLLSMSFLPVGIAYNRRWDGSDTLNMKKILHCIE